MRKAGDTVAANDIRPTFVVVLTKPVDVVEQFPREFLE